MPGEHMRSIFLFPQDLGEGNCPLSPAPPPVPAPLSPSAYAHDMYVHVNSSELKATQLRLTFKHLLQYSDERGQDPWH